MKDKELYINDLKLMKSLELDKEIDLLKEKILLIELELGNRQLREKYERDYNVY